MSWLSYNIPLRFQAIYAPYSVVRALDGKKKKRKPVNKERNKETSMPQTEGGTLQRRLQAHYHTVGASQLCVSQKMERIEDRGIGRNVAGHAIRAAQETFAIAVASPGTF